MAKVVDPRNPELSLNHIAFVVETVAHLNYNPAIRPYVGILLLAAELVRMCTPEQLAKAIEEIDG